MPQAVAVQPVPVRDQVTVVFDELFTVAENDWVAPVRTVTALGFTLTDTTGVAEIVTAAEADLVASATLVAFTETVAGEGALAGAV